MLTFNCIWDSWRSCCTAPRLESWERMTSPRVPTPRDIPADAILIVILVHGLIRFEERVEHGIHVRLLVHGIFLVEEVLVLHPLPLAPFIGQVTQQIFNRGDIDFVHILSGLLRNVREKIPFVEIIDELLVGLEKVVKVRWLGVSPVEDASEAHEDGHAPPDLTRASLLKGHERLEGLQKVQRLVEEVREDPELVAENPDKEERDPPHHDGNEHDHKQGDSDVPHHELEEVGPDRVAGEEQEPRDKQPGHERRRGLVTLSDPDVVVRLLCQSLDMSLHVCPAICRRQLQHIRSVASLL
mmetsp:Transcript_23442/g.68480  ORF Transcript_23442/g.68480 Transcript_23442/m.68480 type:complete len:298 (-) Transcript_23442:422-1315(-)